MSGIIPYIQRSALVVVFQITGSDDKVILQIKLHDRIINIPVRELMLFFIIICKELVNHRLMTDSTYSSKKFVHIQCVKLSFKKLRSQYVFIDK